jgi:hypothetical protein
MITRREWRFLGERPFGVSGLQPTSCGKPNEVYRKPFNRIGLCQSERASGSDIHHEAAFCRWLIGEG